MCTSFFHVSPFSVLELLQRRIHTPPVLSTLDYSPRYTATPGYRLTEPVRIQPAPPYPKISCLGLEGTRVEAEKCNKVHLKKTGKRHGLDIERSDIHRFWKAPLTRIQPEPWPFATQDLQRAEDDLATTGRPTKFMATPQGLCGGCAKHMGVWQDLFDPRLMAVHHFCWSFCW